MWQRAQKQWCYKVNLQLLNSQCFKILIPVCIYVNTVILALDRYPIEKNHEFAIEITNQMFFLVFTIEMVIKLIGLGFKGYLRNRSNVFDGVIIILSTFDLAFFLDKQDFFNGQKEGSIYDDHTNSFTILRLFRLLRVFRLIKYWSSLNFYLQCMVQTI